MGPPKEPSANASIAIGSTGLCSDPSSSNPDGGGTTRASPSPRKSASSPQNQDQYVRTDGAEAPPSHDSPAQGTVQSEQEKAFFNLLEKFMKSQNPTGAPEEAWLKLADTAWAYEKNRADRWRNEINTLLTFAGLFSAVLTAFVVQYYAVLLPAPDFNMIILERILSLQLSNMATNAVVVAAANSSNPVPVPMALTNYLSTNLPPPPAAPRWIAALWFVALVFSLSAASVGLAVNQWLNFHATEQAGLQDASQSIWTWQLRRHALDKGQVENMVSILPSLLQVALVLFLVGIVGYLWELGFDIAVPSTVVVGALLLFLAFTSVSPALGGYSPYKSPQAWWIWKACIRTRWAVYWVVMLLHHMVDVLIKIQIPLQSSSIRVYNIYQRIKDLRASLVQHQARTRTLMMKKNWLEYEASCLDDWITHSKNNTIFRDIYSIANDIAVLRAMETCVRAMPSARAMRHVTQLGQTAFAALSNRQDSRSRAPRPPSGNQHDVPDSTSTTLIGHMVLDEFINIRPQTELDDDTQALDLDSNRRMLSGLIRAMPPTHGIEACMTLFQHLRDDRLSKKQRRATLDVVRNIYVPVDFLAEDLQDSKMQAARTYDCAPYTELYRLRDIENWECVQTALMTVSKLGDPVSTIQIMTIVLAICMLSVKNGHTLPHEPSRGAYLDDMLQRFDEYLATLRRKELKITIRHLPPPAVYILDWALARMSFSDIYSALGATEIRRNIMISTNHIARRLQWLLTRKAWTPQGAVQGFCVQLHWYVHWTQEILKDPEIGQKGWSGWLECVPDEPQSEDDQSVDSSEATDPEPTSKAGDEQDPPEPRTGSMIQSIVRVIRNSWHRLRGTTAAQEPDSDIEGRAVDTSPSAALDVPGATDTATTRLDESPQGQDTAHSTKPSQPLNTTEPHADDSNATRRLAEDGVDADADKGSRDEVGGASEDADERRGDDRRWEETPDTEVAPAQSESHSQLGSQNESGG